MITVIIPTLNQNNYTEQLLDSISNNNVKPERIILINDGGNFKDLENLANKFSDLKIDLINHIVTMGVNYSWNEGLRLSKTMIISVLNNDIILNKYFFENIEYCYVKYDWGIICPETVNKIKNLKDCRLGLETPIIENMKKREGWCWTTKVFTVNKFPPIPNFLRNYCGDDYIFYHVKRLNQPIIKVINNTIYHYGSGTVGVTKECNGLREKEKILWNNYREEYENTNNFR